MPFKTAITAALLLSATALPALAENYANDAARPYRQVNQQPLFGAAVAAQPGTSKDVLVLSMRQEVSNAANAPTRVDAATGSSVPAVTANPHMYDYLSGPEYRGGN
jgi:hypothetical protein